MNFESIDRDLLVTATGGNSQQPQPPTKPERTWGQVARDYAGACVGGATQALVTGRPRDWRSAAVQAGLGCATGVGTQAVQDLSR